MPSLRHPIRVLIFLISTLLVLPLAAALAPAPAYAAPAVLTGSVEDALDQPVGGVTVEPRDLITNSPVPGRSVQTNASGDYALTLVPGDYRVWFLKAGYTSEPYGGVEQPTTVTVTAEGGLVLDGEPQDDLALGGFTLQSATTRTVSSTVTAGGTGYEGVTVRAFAEDDDETVVASTTTAANGTWTLTLPLGRYRIELVAPIRTPQYANTFIGGNATPTLVVVSTGNVSLEPTALPEATNQEFPIVGRAVDANGEPVNGLTVQVLPMSPSTDTATTTTAGTGNDAGEYSASVRPGSYHVSFSGTGFESTTFPGAGAAATVTVAANGSLSVNGGTALPTGRLDDVEVPSTGRPVGGRITAGGSGLAGMTVRATSVEDDTRFVETTSDNAGDYVLQVPVGRWTVDVTDKDGIAPQYAGAAIAGGQVLRVDQDGTFSLDGVAAATLPAQALSEANPDTAYPVIGDLTDANGDPVANITVTATGGANPVTAVSNGDGRYALSLKAGTYRLMTTATGAFAAADYTHDSAGAVDVVVAGNGTVTVDPDGAGPLPSAEAPGRLLRPTELVGLQSTSVTGRAVSAPSTPIAGITAKALLASDNTEVAATSGQTSGTGVYTLSLRIGTYLVELTDTNGADPTYSRILLGGTTDPETATEVKVAQNGVVSIGGTVLSAGLPDTTMTAAASTTEYDVRGSVADVNGDPLAGVTVTAPGRPAATTGSDGKYVLRLTPGAYTPITFSKVEFVTRTYPSADDDEVTGTVNVALDGTITVTGGTGAVPELGEIELVGTTPYSVSGTVRGAGDVDPGAITVEVADDNASTTWAAATTTSAAGAYTLTRVVGTYRIRFVDADNAGPQYALTNHVRKLKVSPEGRFFLDDVLVTSLDPTILSVTDPNATYHLVGTVSDWDGNELNGVKVEAIDPGSGTTRSSVETGPDTVVGNDSLGNAGVYRVPVKAGGYWLRYSKAGYETTWLTSWEDDTKRLVITVGVDGRITTTEEDVLDVDNVITDLTLYDPAPRLRKAPALKGKPSVGQTVTATLGTWDVANPSKWAYYEWFLDNKPADQFSSGKLSERFEVPAKAVGKNLTFRLALEDPDSRRATASFTSKPVKVRPAKPKLAASYAKGVLSVKVTLKGITKLAGKVVVLDGKKKVGKATLSAKSKGRATIRLRGLKAGKHQLVVVFDGPAGYKSVKKKVKVTIS
jgi:hypothetical protein